MDADLTARLSRYRETAAEAIIASSEGNLSRLSMRGLTQSDVADAIRLEWQTVVVSRVYPGMSRKKLLKALASTASVKRMRLRVDFWTALLALLNSGYITEKR